MKTFYKPDVPKITVDDLPEDSVYRDSFPCNSYLWSINKDYIKKKDGSLVDISECRLYESGDIEQLNDLLLHRYILNPYKNTRKLAGDYIYIDSISYTLSSDIFPASAIISYFPLNDDYTLKKVRFHFTDMTITNGVIKSVWQDWDYRFPFRFEPIEGELLQEIEQAVAYDKLSKEKFQYSLF